MKLKAKHYSFLTIILFLSFSLQAAAQKEIPDACKTCASFTETSNSMATTLVKLGVVVGIVVIAMLYGWITYRKKLYLILGSLAVVTILGSYSYALYSRDNVENVCQEAQKETVSCSLNDSEKDESEDVFLSPGDEFESNSKSSESSFESVSDDEFAPVGDEFASVGDEFTEVGDEFSEAGDEFSSVGDEFANTSIGDQETKKETINMGLLVRIIILLVLCVVIGLTLQYKIVRDLRGLVLLSSLVFLGFIKGGCPCIVKSFIDVVLFLFGSAVSWVGMTLFLGLVVVTYFFGKTWCGWLCYLGAFQEFLYRGDRFKILTTPKAQKIIGSIRIGLLITLILQILITHTNIWIHYDPFKVVFNLISTNTISFVLLIMLLVSSLIIYRPFCRVICPVGQILSWVSRIPGARRAVVDQSCTSCKACTRICKQNAISVLEESVQISGECIACGDCLEKCKREAIIFK